MGWAVPKHPMFIIWSDPGHFLSHCWPLWIHLINFLSHFWLFGFNWLTPCVILGPNLFPSHSPLSFFLIPHLPPINQFSCQKTYTYNDNVLSFWIWGFYCWHVFSSILVHVNGLGCCSCPSQSLNLHIFSIAKPFKSIHQGLVCKPVSLKNNFPIIPKEENQFFTTENNQCPPTELCLHYRLWLEICFNPLS